MKNETKHTEGPWHLIEKDDAWPLITDPMEEKLIAKVDTSLSGVACALPEARANARLIAAAPELLTVLQDEIAALETWMRAESIPSDIFEGMQISWNKLSKALAKAKGEE